MAADIMYVIYCTRFSSNTHTSVGCKYCLFSPVTTSWRIVHMTYNNRKLYYSHFIEHLLSRYGRIIDCLYSIVYGQAGRYAP